MRSSVSAGAAGCERGGCGDSHHAKDGTGNCYTRTPGAGAAARKVAVRNHQADIVNTGNAVCVNRILQVRIIVVIEVPVVHGRAGYSG